MAQEQENRQHAEHAYVATNEDIAAAKRNLDQLTGARRRALESDLHAPGGYVPSQSGSAPVAEGAYSGEVPPLTTHGEKEERAERIDAMNPPRLVREQIHK